MSKGSATVSVHRIVKRDNRGKFPVFREMRVGGEGGFAEAG